MARGTPVAIDGKTAATPGPATTTRAIVGVPNPLNSTAPCFTRSLSIRHLSGAGNLLLYLPSARTTPITIKPNEMFSEELTVTHFWVQASAGTVEWEGVAVVAA